MSEATQDTAGPVSERPVDVLNAMFMTKGELAQALGDAREQLRLHKEGNPMTGFIEEAVKAKRAEAERDRFETRWNESQDLLATARENYVALKRTADTLQDEHERLRTSNAALRWARDGVLEAEARAERAEAALERVTAALRPLLATVQRSVAGTGLGYGEDFHVAAEAARAALASLGEATPTEADALPATISALRCPNHERNIAERGRCDRCYPGEATPEGGTG